MRKSLAFAAALVMIAACGCSASGREDSTQDNTSPPEETSVTAVSHNSSGAPDSEAGESIPDEPPDTDRIFDTAPIADAYISGDDSALDSFQKQILSKAAAVIDQCVTEDMTPYEKELALHDWMIRYCTYDKGELRAIKKPGKHCSDPYGALIDGQAICMGYTTTFKLFMDMVGIPCGIIDSTDDEGDEHAWNIVQLDGSWYYVDTTWDDPVPDKENGYVKHQYFNITREEISRRHILPDGAPETDSTEYLFAEHELFPVTDISQITEGVKSALEKGHADLAVYFDMDTELADISDADLSDYYTIPDIKLQKEISAACKKAGTQFLCSSLRSSDRGSVLLIIFEPK